MLQQFQYALQSYLQYPHNHRLKKNLINASMNLYEEVFEKARTKYQETFGADQIIPILDDTLWPMLETIRFSNKQLDCLSGLVNEIHASILRSDHNAAELAKAFHALAMIHALETDDLTHTLKKALCSLQTLRTQLPDRILQKQQSFFKDNDEIARLCALQHSMNQLFERYDLKALNEDNIEAWIVSLNVDEKEKMYRLNQFITDVDEIVMKSYGDFFERLPHVQHPWHVFSWILRCVFGMKYIHSPEFDQLQDIQTILREGFTKR